MNLVSDSLYAVVKFFIGLAHCRLLFTCFHRTYAYASVLGDFRLICLHIIMFLNIEMMLTMLMMFTAVTAVRIDDFVSMVMVVLMLPMMQVVLMTIKTLLLVKLMVMCMHWEAGTRRRQGGAEDCSFHALEKGSLDGFK